MSDNIGSKEYWKQLRFDEHHQLGLGDVRVTIGMQEEITDEIARLRKALGPFAEAACNVLDTADDDDWDAWEHPVAMAVKIGHFRNARAALSIKQPKETE